MYRRTQDPAFTLIELMIVVAIIGMLASVAIPQFTKYLKRSKTTEAPLNLRKIYDGEVAYFYDEHIDKFGQMLTRTFVDCDCQPGKPPKLQKEQGDFGHSGWPHIQFNPDSPTQYLYLVETLNGGVSNPCAGSWQPPGYSWVPPPIYSDGFLARAFGDVDGDDKVSEFARFGLVVSATGELEGSSGMFVLDELE